VAQGELEGAGLDLVVEMDGVVISVAEVKGWYCN
jgi:hypothetical protein